MSSGSATSAETDRRRTVSGEMHIHEIRPRPHGDTRAVDPAHVEALAESIGVLGLLNPITVDVSGNLIAGAHRLAALGILQARGDWQGPVPVTVYPADIASNAKLALDLEVSENDKRRDYSPEEIRGLARRLRAAGYRADCGRPRRGEKAMIPALMVIVGKSKSQVLRALAGDRPQRKRRGGGDADEGPRPLADVAPFPSPSTSGPQAESPGASTLLRLAQDMAHVGARVGRAAVLPLDEWLSLSEDDIAMLAREADGAAEALNSLAEVARSAISMIVERDTAVDGDEIIDDGDASS